MDQPYQFRVRPKPFRMFVTRLYYENRDEYHSSGQDQPHTFDEYYRANRGLLIQQYRLNRG